MLMIKIRDEDDRTHTRVSAERFGELVTGVGRGPGRFLVAQRVPDLPDVFWQIAYSDGTYFLEHRAGPGWHYGVQLSDPSEAVAAALAWARQEAGWEERVAWEWIDWLSEESVPEPVPELPEEVREETESYVRELLRGGYATRGQLREAAEEYLVDGDERPVSRSQARELVDRLWLERVAEQTSWEGTTDPDRIEAAFAQLEERGITAREHFTCCRRCGLDEIREAGRPDARGFVFFHSQCVEGAVAGEGLHLLYGGFGDASPSHVEVGQDVVETLREAGLRVDWGGGAADLMRIDPLDWRKRLVG